MRLREQFLRPDALIEPLVNRWYAWSFLLSPATAAMFTCNLHIRVLESFLQDPQLHRRAAKEPLMRGGMFLDYAGDLEPVRALLERTREISAARVDFANGIRELSQLLMIQSASTGLSDLYGKVPIALKGTVELIYDLQHHLSFRLIEPLLYKSSIHDESLQSISLECTNEESRPFALSTPRFAEPGRTSLSIPLSSPLLDLLSAARETAVSSQLEEFLITQVADTRATTSLYSLFTDAAPYIPQDREYRGPGVRIRYFGHATVLVQTAKIAILLDPLISYPATADQPSRFALHDLPMHIDFILLTHAHQDHVSLETLLQIRHRVNTIVVPRCGSGALQDPSLKLMLKSVGFQHIVELDELESLAVCGGQIIGVPFLGEHGDLDIRSKLAYCIRIHERGLLFLADSNGLEPRLYERLVASLGQIDALYIGLECDGAPLSWLYGPLFSRPVPRAVDQSRRLNSSDANAALRIIEAIDPRRVFVYAMGLEPWLNHVSSINYTPQSRPITESTALLEACRRLNRPAERLFLTHEVYL